MSLTRVLTLLAAHVLLALSGSALARNCSARACRPPAVRQIQCLYPRALPKERRFLVATAVKAARLGCRLGTTDCAACRTCPSENCPDYSVYCDPNICTH